MSCIRTVKYVVKCNMSLFDEINLKRGLHQGDPLSSYLFLFCMEALPCKLLKAQNVGLLHGIMVSQNGSRINHLFLLTLRFFL